MNKNIRITLICILILAILALVGVNIFCVVNKYAKAEELNNDIVNFNQLVSVSHNDYNNYGLTLSINNNAIKLNGTPQFNLTFEVGNINLVDGHYYYYFSNNDNVQFNVINNFLFTEQPYIVQSINTGNYNTQIKVLVHQFNNDIVYCNLIDLTQMYGTNVPTLEQCQEIFTAEYYPYNLGTPIYQSGIANYNQAINDVFSNYTYQLNISALGNNSYGIEYQNDSAYFEYRPSPYSNWYFLNTFGVPLFTKLNSGATITIDYRLYAPNFEGNYYLNIMYYNGNSYSSIYYDPSAIDTTNGNTCTFTLPVDTDTLIFNIIDSNHNVDTEMNMLVFKFDIKANQLDVASAIISANQTGYESARRYLQDEYYNVGGDGYYEIYMEGFRQGQNSDVVSAFDGAWGFISSASSGVASLFQIEILPGLPLATFVLVPLMLGLVFFVVKLGKGGGS